MGTNLYIGNLSFNTSENDLKNKFEEAGQIASCNLIMDKDTGKSRGFAFVEMSSEEDAEKAISLFDGTDLDGRALKVNEARAREDRSRR